MLSIFDGLRDVTVVSITLRLVLAMICGGIVGMEREYKRRSAGFRTHILICLGAAMTTMTSQHLFLNMHYYLDMARMGGSVVAGIGFIGAGTIIVTQHQRVKGLTTAAGLWTVAIVGLALGAGFYEGGILATVLVLLAEMLFAKLEYRTMMYAPEINLSIEYRNKDALDKLLKLYQECDLKVLNMEIIRSVRSETHNVCAIFSLRLPRKSIVEDILTEINQVDGILAVEEL